MNGNSIRALEILENRRANYLELANRLTEKAAEEGRVFTVDEAMVFDLCMAGIADGDIEAAQILVDPQRAFKEAPPVLPAPPAALKPTPRVQHTRRAAEDSYLNAFGRVGRLADDLPTTPSSLGGGAVYGWHPDLVPFSQMDEIPGFGRLHHPLGGIWPTNQR